jgi:L,D-transpeptidase ErfK/SrfK
MVRGESRPSLMLLCAAILLVSVQRQAAASDPTPTAATPGGANPQIQETTVPPIGQPSNFLPGEAPAPPARPTPDTRRLVIRLSERRVYVYWDNRVEASYPIAVGKAGWETPTGTFKVLQKIENPSWQNFRTGEVIEAGPDNPLGARWIGFWSDGVNVIGFHGTPNEETVGYAASHGCIRMLNKDILSLFEKVAVGTPVTVEP